MPKVSRKHAVYPDSREVCNAGDIFIDARLLMYVRDMQVFAACYTNSGFEDLFYVWVCLAFSIHSDEYQSLTKVQTDQLMQAYYGTYNAGYFW